MAPPTVGCLSCRLHCERGGQRVAANYDCGGGGGGGGNALHISFASLRANIESACIVVIGGSGSGSGDDKTRALKVGSPSLAAADVALAGGRVPTAGHTANWSNSSNSGSEFTGAARAPMRE